MIWKVIETNDFLIQVRFIMIISFLKKSRKYFSKIFIMEVKNFFKNCEIYSTKINITNIFKQKILQFRIFMNRYIYLQIFLIFYNKINSRKLFLTVVKMSSLITLKFHILNPFLNIKNPIIWKNKIIEIF